MFGLRVKAVERSPDRASELDLDKSGNPKGIILRTRIKALNDSMSDKDISFQETIEGKKVKIIR